MTEWRACCGGSGAPQRASPHQKLLEAEFTPLRNQTVLAGLTTAWKSVKIVVTGDIPLTLPAAGRPFYFQIWPFSSKTQSAATLSGAPSSGSVVGSGSVAAGISAAGSTAVAVSVSVVGSVEAVPVSVLREAGSAVVLSPGVGSASSVAVVVSAANQCHY